MNFIVTSYTNGYLTLNIEDTSVLCQADIEEPDLVESEELNEDNDSETDKLFL